MFAPNLAGLITAMPMVYLFNVKLQRMMMGICLLGLIVSAVARCLTLPEEDIIIHPGIFRKQLIGFILIVILSFLSHIFFSNVANQLFDNVQAYSEAVEKTTKEKQLFFACMSHEIRNPLHSLL